MQPLVSVIAVHFNNLPVTEEFLQSISNITYGNVEVIVVDNGSEKEPVQPIISDYPEVKFLISDKNLGFAGGNNLGIEKSKGDYLLFINNDTEVPKDFLEPLVSFFKNNKSAGIVSPKIIYHNTDIIQYLGNSLINHFTGRSKRYNYKIKNTKDNLDPFKTGLIHGAAMMTPKSVIEEVGVMPELYFLYYEEIDWCMSIRNAGYEVWCIPDSEVFHKESISTGKASPLKTYYLFRNRILYLRRNTSGLERPAWIFFLFLFTIPKEFLKYFLTGQKDQLKAILKAISWHLKIPYRSIRK